MVADYQKKKQWEINQAKGGALLSQTNLKVLAIAIIVASFAVWGLVETSGRPEPATVATAPKSGVVAPCRTERGESQVHLPESKSENRPTDGSRGIADSLRPFVEASYQSVDSNAYPRGLEAAISEIGESKDGRMAFDTARTLSRCRFISLELDAFRENVGTVRDPAVRKALDDQFIEKNKLHSLCQTFSGDVLDAQKQMLHVALNAGVVGSAASLLTLGVDDGRIRRTVLADAKAGELISLALVAGGDPARFSIDPAVQAAFRGGLVSAANSRGLGGVSLSALVLAQRIGAIESPASGEFRPGDVRQTDGGALQTQIVEAIQRRYREGKL